MKNAGPVETGPAGPREESVMPRLGAVAAAAFALALFASPAFSVDLTHGSWPPAGDHLNTTALPNAFKRIDEQTNGAVKWKLVAG